MWRRKSYIYNESHLAAVYRKQSGDPLSEADEMKMGRMGAWVVRHARLCGSHIPIRLIGRIRPIFVSCRPIHGTALRCQDASVSAYKADDPLPLQDETHCKKRCIERETVPPETGAAWIRETRQIG